MRRILKSMLVVLALALALAVFVGCELADKPSDTTTPECAHEGGTATCTDPAVCEKCGLPYGEPLAHTEVIDPEEPASCTEAGKSEGKHCSVCDTVLVAQEDIPAKGHTEVIDPEEPASCTEAGKSEGKHCSVCDTVLVAQEDIPAKGHTEAIDAAVPPSCIEVGKTEGKHCSVCGTVLVAQQDVPLAEHSWVNASADAPYHCSVCNQSHIVIYYKNVSGWEQVSLWAWINGENIFNAWPGEPMTQMEEKTDWYKIEFDAPGYENMGIIFNNTTGAQTADLIYDPAKLYWVGSTPYATWSEANPVTLSGKLDAAHYADMLPSLSVSVVADKTYTGSISGDTWSVAVPEDLCDFKVVIHDENGRFHDIEFLYAMADATEREAAKLIPVMSKYDLWGNHNGSYVPDQNQLVLNPDGSYSLIKTESGAALDNANWWASGVTTGAFFVGASSEYWVMETEMILLAAGGWNQWHAGVLIDSNEFIMIMDRDWQLMAWTEWNLAANAAGSQKDIITYAQAAAAGIVDSQNWAPADRPMKVTIVRNNKELYVFLNEVFITRLDISDNLLPNSNRGASEKIGFMVKSGTEAKFQNYWYELGQDNVADYLEGKKVNAPAFSVVDDEGNAVEGGSVQFYKEVLISTDSANGYRETTEWQLATEADMIRGALLKAVFAPISSAEGEIVFTGVTLNGVNKTLSDGGLLFSLGESDTIVLSTMLNAPVNAVINVSGLNGATLTFTNVEDGTDVHTPVVANGQLVLNQVWLGSKYNVVADVANVKISLGTLEITGKNMDWHPTHSMVTSGNADIGGNVYTVDGADRGRVDFNALSGSIPAGDVFIVTKVQISAAQLSALLTAKGETVIGIEMRAGGRAVESVLWINGGDIKLLSGDWSQGNLFFSDGSLNEYGLALQGDGLYLGMYYNSTNGMTYTYLGTALENMYCVRDWGTGGSDNPGYRSFEAGSQITGFGFGYVHCWTGNDASLRADVTFSEAFVCQSYVDVLPPLLDMESATLKWQSINNTFGNVGYQNAKGALSYDAEAGVGVYAFDTIATHATRVCGKSFVPYFQGFSITDISEYSTITIRVKIDAATCAEGLVLTVRPFNKTAAAAQRIVAGEWVELTFSIADFTHAWDATVSGYLAAVNTEALTNLGFVFMVEDTATMSIEAGFTMYISDFILG